MFHNTPGINFPGYKPNLTSVKGNLKIYNKLSAFKTWLMSRASNFGLIPEK
jgi:hypothetical protein